MSILKKGKKYQIMFSFNKFHQLLRQNIGEICCHSLRGSVDWNISANYITYMLLSHSLRGSVDWNMRRIANIRGYMVTPYAGVWIEIIYRYCRNTCDCVTPYAGVWIEIAPCRPFQWSGSSLPTRECGLKSYKDVSSSSNWCVTPYAGVWIEICLFYTVYVLPESLPTRECGLKLFASISISTL